MRVGITRRHGTDDGGTGVEEQYEEAVGKHR